MIPYSGYHHISEIQDKIEEEKSTRPCWFPSCFLISCRPFNAKSMSTGSVALFTPSQARPSATRPFLFFSQIAAKHTRKSTQIGHTRKVSSPLSPWLFTGWGFPLSYWFVWEPSLTGEKKHKKTSVIRVTIHRAAKANTQLAWLGMGTSVSPISCGYLFTCSPSCLPVPSHPFLLSLPPYPSFPLFPVNTSPYIDHHVASVGAPVNIRNRRAGWYLRDGGHRSSSDRRGLLYKKVFGPLSQTNE